MLQHVSHMFVIYKIHILLLSKPKSAMSSCKKGSQASVILQFVLRTGLFPIQ